LNSKEEEIPVKCFISKIKLDVPDGGDEAPDFLKLPELQPPNMMPRGNVGTSTSFFLKAINECRLPSKLIGKLKLEFPQSRKRRFGSVPHQYRGNNLMLERRKMEKKKL